MAPEPQPLDTAPRGGLQGASPFGCWCASGPGAARRDVRASGRAGVFGFEFEARLVVVEGVLDALDLLAFVEMFETFL